MIRNREKNIEVTILSKGVKLSGNIETNSDVLIEGEIQGAVSSNGKVIVTADAFVNGNIIANSLELFGKCLGEIFVQRSVVMGNTSFYQGEVTCESIEIQKGAKFTGEVLLYPKDFLEFYFFR
jgi:cytoskeletal protein CcmA (bactofilin family)